MEEDWNSCAQQPSFSLFTKMSPEEAAKKDFIDTIIYNRWSRAERRLYQKLKTEFILDQIAKERLSSVDDIINSLDQLQLIKSAEPTSDPKVDELIGKLESMKLSMKGGGDCVFKKETRGRH